MTERTMLTAIKTRLLAAEWSPGNKVFAAGGVVITSGVHEDALVSLPMPAAIIRPRGGVADPDEPGLQEVGVSVTLVVAVPGDVIGENPLLGAGRQTNTSQGVGLLDLGHRVLQEIKELRRNVVPIDYVARGASDFTVDRNRRYLVWREYEFRARVAVE